MTHEYTAGFRLHKNKLQISRSWLQFPYAALYLLICVKINNNRLHGACPLKLNYLAKNVPGLKRT